MNSPASHATPPLQSVDSATIPRRGGNLARSISPEVPHAGHFFSPSRVFRRVPCSIRLSRNAPSVRECGLIASTANGADCMRDRRGLNKLWSVSCPRRLPSLIHQPAHQFATDDANTYKSGFVKRFSGLGEAGAAGFLPSSPRPSPSLQVNHFAHRDGSFGSLPSISESKRRAFHVSGKTIHDCNR